MTARTVALVAHDHKKAELLQWVKHHQALLAPFNLVATGTTGKLISDETGLSGIRREEGYR